MSRLFVYFVFTSGGSALRVAWDGTQEIHDLPRRVRDVNSSRVSARPSFMIARVANIREARRASSK